MRIRKRIRSTSSDKISLNLPKEWNSLTEAQLRYVYGLKVQELDDQELQVYCFIRFCKIKVHKKTETGWLCSVKRGWFRRKRFFLQAWEVQYFIKILKFLCESGNEVVSLKRIRKFRAVDSLLRDVAFGDYLAAENYYQGYLQTQDDTLLRSLFSILYRDKDNRNAQNVNLSEIEKYAVLAWYYSLKNLFSSKFNYFFKRVESADSEQEMPDMESIMNNEIRALTGGDITKENVILTSDTWRALTELNEKARELKELEDKR